MWKIVNRQWVELTEDEKEQFLKEEAQYFRDFAEIHVPEVYRVEIKARQEDRQQITGWKADISTHGNVVYWDRVYIERFPDLLTFLHDIEALDKLKH